MAGSRPGPQRRSRARPPVARDPAVPAAGPQRLRILSSAHLAEGPVAELSELESGLIVAHNAFARWVVRCMTAAGMPELAVTDVLVLHHVRHRDRGKRLADVCFTLNYEDTHVVSYSLKKLVNLGLLDCARQGKEAVYSVTPQGRALVERYGEVRRRCLLSAVAGDLDDPAALAEVAQLLRTLSGLYDQAARAAASL